MMARFFESSFTWLQMATFRQKTGSNGSLLKPSRSSRLYLRAWGTPGRSGTSVSSSISPRPINSLNLTFPVARYGVGLSFREVFGIEFCDTPQLAAGSFIARNARNRIHETRLDHLLVTDCRWICSRLRRDRLENRSLLVIVSVIRGSAFLSVSDFDIFENAEGVRDENGDREVGADEIGDDRFLIDAHETNVQARLIFVRDTGLV